ncbi:MAG: chemotaxis protein CheW [Novosphingobium sp. 28-62-57]|uniref:chemotaxis protein CheW n=1 Tax=unclassified Novosphingobium TaxID=2644732 RepID=UPI000BCB32B5|nr:MULTISPECIES: chemotaxis protein CheW [unclassified Novosphingobium]OYW48153.1 MAG: chemotaxis protein CheW [Novosphingobium sp. 12-63-9]OYZ08907.1 MAG: chemotaxis protein CheW [Novosphingobium sp. 28-62-57]OZA38061.1 MAG: chemotaxis protein CheW [Novosphingobium sp. 17-62-9]HQS68732.1 chemotaxis protein CheW [Novosphingobium sp.]
MSGADEIQVVQFGLGEEIFAVPVTLVREILDYKEPFHVPGGPAYFLGLTDMRGNGVPTVDLRLRLGLPHAAPTLTTRILILDLTLADRALTLGVVIDRVLSVTSIASARIEAAPDIGVRWNSDYITGVVRDERGFVVIVDIARIFSTSEASALLGDIAAAA